MSHNVSVIYLIVNEQMHTCLFRHGFQKVNPINIYTGKGFSYPCSPHRSELHSLSMIAN